MTTVFGGRVGEIIESVSRIQRSAGGNGEQHIASDLDSMLSIIKESGQEDNLSNLKGILFEFLLYPLFRAKYGNAAITHGKFLSRKNEDKSREGYEYDFIIQSDSPKEIVVIEAKGYSPENRIPLGRSDEKNSLSWFFGRTLPFLKTFYSKEIADGYALKACYITSASFYVDGMTFLDSQSQVKFKSHHLEGWYDGTSLLQLFTTLDLNISRETLQKYYLTPKVEADLDFLR